MTESDTDDLRAHIDREVAASLIWQDDVLSQEQARNLSYYFGNPLGDEAEGRSQLVSWDVFEVVETATPEFLEPFFSEEKLADLDPVTPADLQYAKDATEYVNYKLLKSNPAFEIFSSWVKDGLLAKLGVVRVWFDETKIKQRRTYKMPVQAITMLAQDPKVEIVEAERVDEDDGPPQFDPMTGLPIEMYEVTCLHDRGPRGLRYENVAPENFVISRHAVSEESVTTLGEIRCYRASDLVDMGFPKDQIDELTDYDINVQRSEIRQIRDRSQSVTGSDFLDVDPNRQIHLFFGFTRYDANGDGVAEWRRVLMGGNGEPLENDEVDDHEYCMWTPIKVPHRVHGMAYADPVAPIQELNTSLQRQFIDSLFLANNPRTYAVDKKVNMADLLDNRIGGIVRMSEPGMAGPMVTSTVAVESMNGLEWGKTMRENRIGVLRNGTGLDKDSLNPRTAKEVSVVESAQQRRMKTALRLFSEMGVKNLVRKALRLTVANQDEPEQVYDGKVFKSFNPQLWNPEMAVTIRVGLGTGDNSELLQSLQMFGQFMQMVASQGMPIVQPNNIYEYGRQLATAGKLKSDLLLTDPKNIPPQPPKPSPEEIKVQGQIKAKEMELQAKGQADAMTAQAETAADIQKFNAEANIDAVEAEKQRAHELMIEQMKIRAAQDKELLALAAGIISAHSGGGGQNLINGTQTDQTAQAPGVNLANLGMVMRGIQQAAGALQNGASVGDVNGAIFSALNGNPQ